MKSFSSLPELFHWRVEKSPEHPALGFRREGRYQFLPWKVFSRNVHNTALALYQEGVRKGDRVAILSENRPEWAYADLGILSLGGVSVPIYPTTAPKECHYILEHAEVKIIFLSSREQFEKIRPLLEKGVLKRVVIFDLPENISPEVMSFKEFCESGRLAALNNEGFLRGLIARLSPDDLATLIYTSGTTGPPKGVMLTHGNFLSNCAACSQVLPIKGPFVRSLSFLPLSHVFERMAGYYFMIWKGITISYAQSMQTVPEDLGEVRPTVAASVPRFYEKMHARILENVQTFSPLKRKIFFWSLQAGREVSLARSRRKAPGTFLLIKFVLAKLLVFGKLKKKLGGRIQFFISGGAPLAKELAEFFHAADVLILEGYGLTETSPVISVNRPEKFKFGTVGLPLDGVEVRIAEDGEILTRGPHIMKGYFKNEEATREAMRDGWFHTGDLGEIDSEGFLKITGRKKDIIVTAGGKNISPQNIENELRGDPLFSQAVLIGDKRPYLVALIVLCKEEALRLARHSEIAYNDWEDLIQKPAFYACVDQRLRARMKDFASYEQIKYFEILPAELCQEKGELTPTLKVKRRVVTEHYAASIDRLYQKRETHAAHPVPSG